ncbi:MAG: lysophospholipid acyltransferase family protein [Elusimicrobia bacterium]|nr:lysophospholipid acyltransferase family protein [Elusimicrobiota bacterium]
MLKALIPYLGYFYIWIVGKTSRITWKGSEIPRNLESQGINFVYAFWHSRQFFFVYSHRHQPVSILVSSSRDGEYIAKMLELSGMKTVRGSSTRGGSKALKELVDHARQGNHLGITPDGPRGPAREVKQGVLFLAQKLGLSIIPITYAAKRKMVFGSWDKIHLPLPCNRIVIAHGTPIQMSSQDSLEEKSQELKMALDHITRQADEMVSIRSHVHCL